MNIFLVTDITGFPFGTAAASRIRMIGKAFLNGGNNFTVLTNTPYYNELNKEVEGDFECIHYQYLGKTISLKHPKFLLFFIYLRGCLHLIFRIARMNKSKDIVYIYSQGKLFNALAVVFCKLFSIKIIQEINEWYFRQLGDNLGAFIMEKIALRYSSGVIAISSTIEKEVLKINRNIKTIIIPALEDCDNFQQYEKMEVDNIGKYCFWMGLVNTYTDDIIFIIKGLASAYKSGLKYKFCIAGRFNKESELKIKEICEDSGYPFEAITLLGYVDEEELQRYCKNAFFYILPLWDDMRSNARFPTKLASFLFCGKPVITCKVGDVGNLLLHKKNVLFYNINDYIDLCKKVQMLSDDSELYNKIATNSERFAKEHFDYRNYSNQLNEFLNFN